MSTLNTFNLVNAVKPRSLPPIMRMRNKLSDRIWEQIKLAEARKIGSNYAPLKTKRLKDIEGNIKHIELPKRIKPWWFNSESGKLCLTLFYGAKHIEIRPGKTAIEVNNFDELLQTLEAVRTAITNGELDEQITNACNILKAGFRK